MVYSPAPDPEHLRGIVDMGSNGIRFSISSLHPSTSRIVPTIYQHRAAISLYDAQYTPDSSVRQPIGEGTMTAVVAACRDFRRTCSDFGVRDEHVVILATEATRTAINSDVFCSRIEDATGWKVRVMAKEDEGRIGAMGIASSLPEVEGLVMDLGGGSTQLTWLLKERESGHVQMPERGSVSMPFGAAAMSRRLRAAEMDGSEDELKHEIRDAVADAYRSLHLPGEMESRAGHRGGFTLYLSGGGFRGWGYVLMSRHHVQPYPISTINGFRVSRAEFVDTQEVKMAAATMLQDEDEDIFRVSDRRAGQVPAVAFLINTLAEALPQIKEVRFCQGGVREGYLFAELSPDVRKQHPLVVATLPFAPRSSESIAQLLDHALPRFADQTDANEFKAAFSSTMLQAFANLMYHHSAYPKDLQASSALRSTTSGILANVHGVLHESRALLALLLCARWAVDVPPADQTFMKCLEGVVGSPEWLWWINYLGAIAALVAAVYPAGYCNEAEPRMRLQATWTKGDKSKTTLSLHVGLVESLDQQLLSTLIRDIEKAGKKKRWIGGREGVGHKVAVQVAKL